MRAAERASLLPRATYRLQFNASFRLEDARHLVPYLARLGISHLYASPLMMARQGSPHGYDIVDHTRLNPEIGSDEDFRALVEALSQHSMGLIVDFVPNHMGVGTDNAWWMDVLEWGRASPYAGYFDIDWAPLEPTLAGKVLLPVLADHYGSVLEQGGLALVFEADGGRFRIGCGAGKFPVALREYPRLLTRAAALVPESEALLRPISEALAAALKGRAGQARRRQQRAEIDVQRRRLAEQVRGNAAAASAIEALLQSINPDGRDAEPEALHRLLERQHYRLAYWRVATHEINYRRFFDINELAGLRVEEPALFDASHQLIFRWLREGMVQGLRLDHVDGLRQPRAYLQRLQRLGRDAGVPARQAGSRAVRWRGPLYLLVEKILAPHEELREDWSVSGTTGYEFMRDVSGVFIDPDGERGLTRTYHRFIGRAVDYEELLVTAKRDVMRQVLTSELNVLANGFNRLAKRSRYTRDYTLTALREALADIVAHFPVYRSYVTGRGVSAEDRRDIGWAVGRARARSDNPDRSIFDFIRAVLTLDILQERPGEFPRPMVTELALRMQQYTAPVMAKSEEDTAFYRYMRLVSLNEVGSEPRVFGTAPEAFHAGARRRVQSRPFSMLATATHDHKRGEDVRARLNVLSGRWGEWGRRVRRWAQMNAPGRRQLEHAGDAPSSNDEYLLYQSLVGSWPMRLQWPELAGLEDFRGRIVDYMRKAIREAKLNTSWLAPHEDYEQAMTAFVEHALSRERSGRFLEDMADFVAAIAPLGAINGLAQTLLKVTAPGVPDIYQGSEYWDLSLVDPDNRRPVDFELRQRTLQSNDDHASLLEAWPDGRIKQYVVARTLEYRQQHPLLFAAGDYRPLAFNGDNAERLMGYVRSHQRGGLVVIVPRLACGLTGPGSAALGLQCGRTSARLPQIAGMPAMLREVLTGQQVRVGEDRALPLQDLLATLPVALLAW